MMRRFFVGLAFSVGVIGSIATGEVTADISGQSPEESVVLTADEPSVEVGATSTLSLGGESRVSSGEIAINVSPDEGAGSLTVTLRSSSGEESSVDIIDTESQGATRLGIDAFSGCTSTCSEELTLIFDRTDTELEGNLGITWSLEALATSENNVGGTIDFEF
jgi:hypothetical protein